VPTSQKNQALSRFPAFSVLFFVAVLLFLSACSPVPPPPPHGASWTVMVYLNADNDLVDFGLADMLSMEEVGSSPRMNIVVQYDTFRGPARRYLVQQSDDPLRITSPVLQELGEINMGDGRTLSDFMHYAASRFPADRYALIIWNHGTGFKRGLRNISFDDTFGDSITIPELGWALAEGASAVGGRLDLLVMDACLMNMVEVAYEVRHSARVLVASQENVPGAGMDYPGFLRALKQRPSMNERELARVMVDTYISFYNQYLPWVTQSAVDLFHLADVAGGLGELAADIPRHPSSLAAFRSAANAASRFDDQDYADVADFLRMFRNDPRTGQDVLRRIEAVERALRNTIFYSRSGGRLAGGLSIYLPRGEYHPAYSSLSFARDTGWGELVRSYLRPADIFDAALR